MLNIVCVFHFTVQQHLHQTKPGAGFAAFLKDRSSMKQKTSLYTEFARVTTKPRKCTKSFSELSFFLRLRLVNEKHFG